MSMQSFTTPFLFIILELCLYLYSLRVVCSPLISPNTASFIKIENDDHALSMNSVLHFSMREHTNCMYTYLNVLNR